MNLYKLTEKDVAARAIKELYETHLESVIEMLTEEPEVYNTFNNVDVILQEQKAQFVEMTLEPLMQEIKVALEEALNRLTVQTVSIEVDAEGLKDAKFKVNVTEFDDIPF
jgi:hypothetical protein